MANLFLSVLMISIITATTFTTLSYSQQCLHHQKTSLLQLKNELKFDSSNSTKLVQWNRKNNDCCNWYGVGCDGAGHVTSLQLDHEAISGGIDDSSSLFRLEFLEKLNLAYNVFNRTQIPRGIQNLTYLTHLNLSNAGFTGQVPLQLSFLTRLVSLDISKFRRGIEPLKLERPNLETLLQNLSGLRELCLDGVDVSSQKSEWGLIISSCLPNIRSLSLRYCSVSGPLHESLSKLQSLSILILDGNHLSSVVPNFFANFSSLTTLSLKNCSLEGSFPEMIFQKPTLQNLDLSQNMLLGGSIPPFTQNGSLRSMILSQTNFSGSIPSSISNLKSLSHIDLSSSRFTGPIPSTLGNLSELTYVRLWANFFTGSLPSTLFRGLSNLDSLELGCNSFTGYVPQSLFDLPSLRVIKLEDNKFIGQVEEFPNGINVSSHIVTLDMSMNLLEGHVPISLFQIQSLENLVLSHNSFSGTFQMKNVGSPNLEVLDLSYNNLSVDANVDPTWHGFPKLRELSLASCHLHAFPEFLKHSAMIKLDLSNNRIDGEIPRWIWGTELYIMNLSCNLLTDVQKPYHIPASLQLLDLHSNRFKGDLHLFISPIGDLTPSLKLLSLAKNSFSGSIPTSLCNAMQLGVVDLSLNELSGDIPPCLLENTRHIQVLNLGRNNISGRIPDNFPPQCGLHNLDLNNNAIQGKIPKSLESCMSLEIMNVGHNSIDDTFPCMLPPSLSVLVLRSNRFHGEVTCERRSTWPNLQIIDISSNNFNGSLESINFSSWTTMVLMSDARFTQRHSGTNFLWTSQFYYTAAVALTIKRVELELVKIWPDFIAVDLSCNDFHGDIPDAIGDLTSLYVLNISHNALGGSIPESFGHLSRLESLDLSRNQLTGHVPTELGGLTFLSVLNLSYNELVGEIPNGRQMHTFLADSFQGNAGLCGRPLERNCSDDRSQGEIEIENEIEWVYVFVALGYVVGLGIIVWLLLFCRSFRYKYFDKIDKVVQETFDARDGRRRRRRGTRIVRNQVVRRSH
uniref:Verticillium wilt resistance-like protein n=1 Tax=Mentha longifolia TaxID=38859 RepID=B2LVF2_MENLO|nr:verticillium wilt resistance-like protein [Mentha longifolia]